jgi:hypothetical protein
VFFGFAILTTRLHLNIKRNGRHQKVKRFEPPTSPAHPFKTHQFWRGDINSIGQEAARFSMEDERFFYLGLFFIVFSHAPKT